MRTKPRPMLASPVKSRKGRVTSKRSLDEEVDAILISARRKVQHLVLRERASETISNDVLTFRLSGSR